MPILTEAQRNAAQPWLDQRGCCIRLAARLINNMDQQDSVMGCGDCPITCPRNGPRNKAAIGELAELLKTAK